MFGCSVGGLIFTVEQYIMFYMKTTLDIPDSLYRQFKTRAAMNGETMRNATLNFIVSYISAPQPNAEAPLPDEAQNPELPDWLGYGSRFVRANGEGPHDMASIRASIARKRFAKGVVR